MRIWAKASKNMVCGPDSSGRSQRSYCVMVVKSKVNLLVVDGWYGECFLLA